MKESDRAQATKLGSKVKLSAFFNSSEEDIMKAEEIVQNSVIFSSACVWQLSIVLFQSPFNMRSDMAIKLYRHLSGRNGNYTAGSFQRIQLSYRSAKKIWT